MPVTYQKQEGAGDIYIFDAWGVEHKTIEGDPSASVFVSAATAIYDPDKPETAAKAQKILDLEEPFSELKPPIVHLIAEGQLEAGPQLGNPDLPEDLLRSLAQLVKAEREKWDAREEAWRAQRQSQHWSLFEKIVKGVGVTLVGVVGFAAGKWF